MHMKNGFTPIKSGFTLPEIVVVIGILFVLTGFTISNLFGAKHTTSLNTSIETFIADLKHQQIKAMVGDTEGRATADSYGVYFGQSSYTLFHGAIYSQGDPSNFTINLGDNIQFANVLFLQSQIVFEKGSGNVSGFVAGSNSVTLRNTLTNEQKVVTTNRFGAVISVN